MEDEEYKQESSVPETLPVSPVKCSAKFLTLLTLDCVYDIQ
jgi:hypothetical protein